jgi:hypothetical protein
MKVVITIWALAVITGALAIGYGSYVIDQVVIADRAKSYTANTSNVYTPASFTTALPLQGSSPDLQPAVN